MPRQLPLPFVHAPHYPLEAFLPAASNAEALEWLHNTSSWPQGRLALFGPEGCGKTHLLRVWARRHEARLLAGPMLPVSPPTVAVAVDDADAAAERPLLHLLNAAAEAGLPVLLAGRDPPARWSPGLADLASRLRATTAVRIGPAEDGLLQALLARLLSDRDVVVSEALQGWLLLRLPRSQGAIREAVARLDRAGLAAGGPITRGLAEMVLAEMRRCRPDSLPVDDVLSSVGPAICPDAGRLL